MPLCLWVLTNHVKRLDMSIIYYPGYSQVVISPNFIVRTILSITQAYPAVITTDVDHGYKAGMLVTFLVPVAFGMQQLNGLHVQVISLTSDTLTVDLDTRTFTPFAYPSPLPSAYTKPSVIPFSSGPYLPPQPLQYGNQDSFDGTIYNAGQP